LSESLRLRHRCRLAVLDLSRRDIDNEPVELGGIAGVLGCLAMPRIRHGWADLCTPVNPVQFQMDLLANFSVCSCVSIGYTPGMVAKDSGLRSGVECPLRKAFPEVCRKQDKHAAQGIREFMLGYLARHASRRDVTRTAEHLIGNTLS
jgi:hypothetical protein